MFGRLGGKAGKHALKFFSQMISEEKLLEGKAERVSMIIIKVRQILKGLASLKTEHHLDPLLADPQNGLAG